MDTCIFADPLPRPGMAHRIDGYGNRCRRFRAGVCEASVGNFHVSSRHRAPLSEPAGRVFARMAANQRMEIHRKRNLTPARNVGIYALSLGLDGAANGSLPGAAMPGRHGASNYRLTDRKPLGYTDNVRTEFIHEVIPDHGENPPTA